MRIRAPRLWQYLGGSIIFHGYSSCRLVSQKRHYNGALRQQLREHLTADALVSVLISALRSCSSISCCQALHAQALKRLNYRHGYIGDMMVTCYLNLGHDENAEKLFDELPKTDLVSWNSLISAFARKGCLSECQNELSKMVVQSGLRPNEVTLISIISGCTRNGAVDGAKCIHGYAVKFGMLEDVKLVNTLINFYGRIGDVDSGRRLFEATLLRNSSSWNCMILMHAQNGSAKESLEYFNIMRCFGAKYDEVTILAILEACQVVGISKLAKSLHGLVICSGLNRNVRVATAFLDLYAKLGNLSDSCRVFTEVVHPDRVTWTAMLAAYAVHGCGREAIRHFELMVDTGVNPDHVTFTHLLSACSHSGLVEEGKHYFKTMFEMHGVKPRLDHYSCMADLMGRSGLLHEAYELIKGMPMEPNVGVWGALLGACRVYKNTELGREVAEKMFALDPTDARSYIMLSNIYSAAGLWRDASRVRVLMKKKGLSRYPGSSSIEHDNVIHRFVVGEWCHPESKKIQKKLEDLMRKIREAGFAPKTEFVLHDVDEEIKEDMINQHSEKLAVAFGLLVTNAPAPIIITKNLRICGDCHSTAKAISLIEQRTIIIRDPKRFHHFSEGRCSCRDYW